MRVKISFQNEVPKERLTSVNGNYEAIGFVLESTPEL